jgi:hypothetical protein
MSNPANKPDVADDISRATVGVNRLVTTLTENAAAMQKLWPKLSDSDTKEGAQAVQAALLRATRVLEHLQRVEEKSIH